MKLVGEDFVSVPCQACKGSGKQRAEDTLLRNGQWARSAGFVPCEKCLGTKVVMRPVGEAEKNR